MAEEIALQKLMVIFQMTYVGAPMVYYGDEAGMWGANDPCCRKPMVWPELSYEAEATLPDGTQKVRPDVVAFDHDLFAHYQKLIHIRNLTPALQVGDFQTLSTDDAGRLYAFRRHHQGEEVLVVLNASGQVRRAEIQMDGAGTLVDLLNGGVTYEIRDGRLIVEVAGRWGAVLRRQLSDG
jgi:cyclomaltodextrinase